MSGGVVFPPGPRRRRPACRDDVRLESVDVAVRSSEQLAPWSIAGGLRLATVDANGGVVKTATAAPQLVAGDGYSAHFALR